MKYFTLDKQTLDLQNINIDGRILDIGGGGEGIIAQLCGDNTIVIDKRRDELEESPDIGIKIVMDACNLQFLDETFDNITCFYSLMYMDVGAAPCRPCPTDAALREAHRVLKPGGHLWIWDAIMSQPADADVFVVPLDITLPNKSISTTYGISWYKAQSAHTVANICESIGFTIVENISYDGRFHLRAVKGKV